MLGSWYKFVNFGLLLDPTERGTQMVSFLPCFLSVQVLDGLGTLRFLVRKSMSLNNEPATDQVVSVEIFMEQDVEREREMYSWRERDREGEKGREGGGGGS